MTNNFTESDFEFGDFFLNKKREPETTLNIKLEKHKTIQGIYIINPFFSPAMSIGEKMLHM